MPDHSESVYVAMRDGVRIALDVWLPERATQPVPAILHQTRYMRSVAWHPVARALDLGRHLHLDPTTRQRFNAAGYAWIDVDVRGSGASFGTRPYPWHQNEVRDGAEIVDWIIRQPWSNGLVGATGISYGGTTAEMLLINKHPAVRAVAPRFSLYDVFTDVAFPGGVHLEWFTKNWAQFNRLLDANRYPDAVADVFQVNLLAFGEHFADEGQALLAQLAQSVEGPGSRDLVAFALTQLASGVMPVAGFESDVADAVTAHQHNGDVHEGALRVTHRDDTGVSPFEADATIDHFSPHTYQSEIDQAGAALLNVSGWLDGAYQRSAIKRHEVSQTSWLLLGPWDHGGGQQISPFSPTRKPSFDHDGELLRFFDAFLSKPARGYSAPNVRYFTMGQERWKDATSWPPPEVEPTTLFLGPDRQLLLEAPEEGGSDANANEPVGTGLRSRWRTLLRISAPVGYDDRRRVTDRQLVYSSAVLSAPLEVTGSPVLTVWVDGEGAQDATLFAYLEDEQPSGRVQYITEGQLRALHRRISAARDPLERPQRSFRAQDATALPTEPVELCFDLLPVSYELPAGHRLRISIAGCDVDHFAVLNDAPGQLRVCWGPRFPSQLELPVCVGRS